MSKISASQVIQIAGTKKILFACRELDPKDFESLSYHIKQVLQNKDIKFGIFSKFYFDKVSEDEKLVLINVWRHE